MWGSSASFLRRVSRSASSHGNGHSNSHSNADRNHLEVVISIRQKLQSDIPFLSFDSLSHKDMPWVYTYYWLRNYCNLHFYLSVSTRRPLLWQGESVREWRRPKRSPGTPFGGVEAEPHLRPRGPPWTCPQVGLGSHFPTPESVAEGQLEKSWRNILIWRIFLFFCLAHSTSIFWKLLSKGIPLRKSKWNSSLGCFNLSFQQSTTNTLLR